MLKKSFFSRQDPAVTLLMRGGSIEEIIANARRGEFEGADAIAVELCDLPPELRTTDNFRHIMHEVRLPFMFLLYRNDRWLKNDDDARQQYLLNAAEAGAELIDVMGDLFAPARRELAVDSQAIEKQKRLIGEIHARGAKVLMSSHMTDSLSAEEVLAHLREQSARGADVLKIVTGVNSEAELVEAIRTTMLLNRELDKPFLHFCNGSHARLHRFIGPKLGGTIVFAVCDYLSPGLVWTQPTIRAMKNVMQNIPWHPDDVR